jgi:hypothetical protein
LRAGRPAVLGVGHRTWLGALGANGANAEGRPPRGKRPSGRAGAGAYAAATATAFGSTGMPGPVLAETVTLRM